MKPSCNCAVCNAMRGGNAGKNNPRYGIKGEIHPSFGQKYTKEWKEVRRKARLGKTWEEIFGIEKAKEARKKASKKFSGKNNPQWKGGRAVDKDGYIKIHQPQHPHSTQAGYILEHRLIMEKYLGRYLKPNELVHHINGNKKDNRIENLMLANHGNHKLRYVDGYTDGYKQGYINGFVEASKTNLQKEN